jgi:hypothetical protein
VLRHDSAYVFSPQPVSAANMIIFAQTCANEWYGDLSPIWEAHN